MPCTLDKTTLAVDGDEDVQPGALLSVFAVYSCCCPRGVPNDWILHSSRCTKARLPGCMPQPQFQPIFFICPGSTARSWVLVGSLLRLCRRLFFQNRHVSAIVWSRLVLVIC